MRRSAARASTTAARSTRARVMGAAEGYDIAAGSYADWSWNRFWDQAELPLVRSWLASRPIGSVADLGCGLGRYRELTQSRGDTYVGVDISENMLEENDKRHRRLRGEGRLIRADLTALPIAENSIDSAICTRVLSHIREPGQAFCEVARILKPGGECFITDIDPSHAYQYTHMPTPDGDVAIETYKHPWSSLNRQLAAAGLKVESRSVLTPSDLHRGATPLRLPNGRLAQKRPLLYACVVRKETGR